MIVNATGSPIYYAVCETGQNMNFEALRNWRLNSCRVRVVPENRATVTMLGGFTALFMKN